jgi:hypothetical protein
MISFAILVIVFEIVASPRAFGPFGMLGSRGYTSNTLCRWLLPVPTEGGTARSAASIASEDRGMRFCSCLGGQGRAFPLGAE